MRETWTLRGTLVLSVLAHAWAIHAAPQSASPRLQPPPAVVVEFSRQEPTPPIEPEPQEEPAPEPEPVPLAAPPQVVAPEPEMAASEPEAAPEEPSPPLELTGTTLTVEGEGSFDAEMGSGRARRGAIRAGSAAAPSSQAPPSPSRARAPAQPQVPDAIPLAQLSRKPAPPDLGRALEKNFPLDARRQGKGGEALVRARVEPSGVIRTAQISFESGGGFGDACRRTLLESKWTAPLDRAGTPVATWVSYRCKFRVD